MTETYRVAAATGFRGHQLGDEVDADPDDPAVRRAIARGSLEPVKKKTKTTKTETEEEDDE